MPPKESRKEGARKRLMKLSDCYWIFSGGTYLKE